MTLLLWIGLLVCALVVTLADRLHVSRHDGLGKLQPNATTHYDPRELEGLPAPVQRYFRAVLKDGQPMGVQWAAVDATSAKATIVDGTITLTLLFHFNEMGLSDSVRAEARGGMLGLQMLMRPWECGLSDYQVRDGMTVPMAGAAAWVLPGGPWSGPCTVPLCLWLKAAGCSDRAAAPARPRIA